MTDDRKPVTLSAKIREEVNKEQELLRQKEYAAASELRLRSLISSPVRGKSRLKAHAGQLYARKMKARDQARAAKRSKSR